MAWLSGDKQDAIPDERFLLILFWGETICLHR
jgi:hypothetical protein